MLALTDVLLFTSISTHSVRLFTVHVTVSIIDDLKAFCPVHVVIVWCKHFSIHSLALPITIAIAAAWRAVVVIVESRTLAFAISHYYLIVENNVLQWYNSMVLKLVAIARISQQGARFIKQFFSEDYLFFQLAYLCILDSLLYFSFLELCIEFHFLNDLYTLSHHQLEDLGVHLMKRLVFEPSLLNVVSFRHKRVKP